MMGNSVDCRPESHGHSSSLLTPTDRDKQHLMLYMAVGGLYVPKDDIRRILAPEPGVEKSILDLGKE